MPNDNKKGMDKDQKPFEQERFDKSTDKSSSKQPNKQDRPGYSGSKQGSSR